MAPLAEIITAAGAFISMVSHKTKAIFWLLPRTGSRLVSEIIEEFCFVDPETGLSMAEQHSHYVGIPEGCEGYHISCTVRNPLSWVVSCWHLHGHDMTFPQFVRSSGVFLPFNYLQRVERLAEPHVWIRYESMRSDLLKVDYIRLANINMDPCFLENKYSEEHGIVLKRDPKDSRYSDYLSYYTDKELNKVHKIYEKYFEKFSYAKETL